MNHLQKIRLLAVVGPTASGKTALGVRLAEELNGEVVSADSMQIYRFLSISTARPTEEEMHGIAHHLIGFVSPDESYSVARYLEDARNAISDIVSRGKLPVLVGGTGLYVSSLLDGIRFSEEKSDPALRLSLQREAAEKGAQAMLDRLNEIDPEYAATLHPNNLGRVLRALELYLSSGVTMTEQRRRSREIESEFDPLMIGVDFLDRQKLYDRINLRVTQMMQQGLLEEARAFYEKYPSSDTAAQAIGCKELRGCLDGTESQEDCLERLRMETRRYAKRQRTWFRRNERVHWFYPDAYRKNSDFTEDVLSYVRQNL